jgi:glutathione S-transferase
MKLYYSKGSCSLAVRMVMNELGLNADFEAVDLKAKKTENGIDYLTISAKGAVPALLLDNGELITENTVIQQYLADTYKATNLLPSLGDFKRYRVLEWLNFVTTDMHKNYSPFFNPSVPQEVKESAFKPLLERKLKFVDAHLEENDYLMGESISLPDFYLFVTLRWMPVAGFNREDFKGINSYFERMKKHASITKSLLEEGLN